MGIHVVQVGLDDSVFHPEVGSDTLTRQRRYAERIAELVPGSVMTYVAVAATAGTEVREGPLRLVPVLRPRLAAGRRVIEALEDLHGRHPINVVSPQDIRGFWRAVLRFARPRKIPVLGQIHYDFFSPFALSHYFGPPPQSYLRRLSTVRRAKQHAALRVVNEATARGMERAGVHVPVKVIPVPVTLGSEQLDLLGEVLVSDKPDTELVLFVGRLVDEKALRTWLRVAKEVAARRPSARFRMVGDGPCRGELERELRTLGLSEILELSGHRPNIALAAHYREAAVFLLSSEAEGFGRVLVEASRFGAALVSTRVAGAEDIIRAGETGLMAEVGDVATLAHHVAGLLADPEGRRRMAETAFADLRQRFHPDELASRWAAFLVEVAQGGAGT